MGSDRDSIFTDIDGKKCGHNIRDPQFAYEDCLKKAPYYLETSRQTLKNQFELPVVFYFLIVLLYINETITIYELILSWIFSISRYLHCYIRLTSNYVPYRATLFIIGCLILIILSIDVLIHLPK